MRTWTAIPSFDGVDLTESFILSWTVKHGDALFEMDFALAKDHPDYREPVQGEWACFRRGALTFPKVRSIEGLPPMADIRPAADANGELDFGHFDSFVELAHGRFEVSVDFGVFRIDSDQPVVAVHAVSL